MSEIGDSQKDLVQQKGEVQYLFVGNKAGLENVDHDKITKIINETTQTSEFYKRQQMKRQQYDERIAEMNLIIEQTKQDPIKLMKIKQGIDDKVEEFKQQLALDRVWVHFDMDMFYVACEIKDRPELKDLPVAVGGLSMISTANYVARKYGVRSAMPGFIGKRLCPQLILIPCNFDKYRKASDIFKNVLYQYDSDLESLGLDEANLDITDYIQSNDINTDAQIYDLCNQIRKQVFEATGGLSCSCGIGPNKMIAKICSDINKPNGQFQIANDGDKVREFMKELPIRKIPGIGNVSEQLLKGIGVERCGQILERMIDIKICFKDLSFQHLVGSSLGVGRSQHTEDVDKKSLSISRTFPQISTVEEIHDKIKQLSQKLSEDAIDEQKVGKHLSVQFKNIKFEIKSKNRMIGKYIQDAESIEKIAKELVKELLPTEPLRLIGIRLSHLANENEIKNGINKFFNKGDKSMNESGNISSKSNSKKSKNVSQLSIKNLFKSQNDKLLLESQNISKTTDFLVDDFTSLPKFTETSQTNTSFDAGIQKLISKQQPQFLNLIDNYENSRSENDSDEDENYIKSSKLTKNSSAQVQKTQLSQRSIDQLKLINQIDSDVDQDSYDDDNCYQNKVNKQYEEDDDDIDSDNEDDIAYLKKILNKNVSDRLSQISEKRSQEEQRQSLSSGLSNTMTPQFVFQNNNNNNTQQKQVIGKQMIAEIPQNNMSFQHEQQQQQQQQLNQQNLQQRIFQSADKQMQPENNIKYMSFQSQQQSSLQNQKPQQQQQYFQRKNDEQNVDYESSNDKYGYNNMINSAESSIKVNQLKRSTMKFQQNHDKENSNSSYQYDEFAEQMSQQFQQSIHSSQMKKRQSQEPLTPQQLEEQMKLKKKFIPKLFECPICFQQIDSYGNVTFVNTHITNCMKTQEEKFQKADMVQEQQAVQRNKQSIDQKQNQTSIFNSSTSDQNTKAKQSVSRKSGQKKSTNIKHTLDSYIIKQNH